MAADESFLELSDERILRGFIKLQGHIRGILVRKALLEIQKDYEEIVADIDGDITVHWPSKQLGLPAFKKSHFNQKPGNSRNTANEPRWTDGKTTHHLTRKEQRKVSTDEDHSTILPVPSNQGHSSQKDNKTVSCNSEKVDSFLMPETDVKKNECSSNASPRVSSKSTITVETLSSQAEMLAGSNVDAIKHLKPTHYVSKEVQTDIVAEQENAPTIPENDQTKHENEQTKHENEQTKHENEQTKHENEQTKHDNDARKPDNDQTLANRHDDPYLLQPSPVISEISLPKLSEIPSVSPDWERNNLHEARLNDGARQYSSSKNEVVCVPASSSSSNEMVSSEKSVVPKEVNERVATSNESECERKDHLVVDFDETESPADFVGSREDTNHLRKPVCRESNAKPDTGSDVEGDTNPNALLLDLPKDKNELLKLKSTLAMELLWIEQAIHSRKNYLRLKHQLS